MAIGQSNSNTAGGTLQGQANPNQAVARPKQQGSGFTNLQKVIGANQGNKLGSTIASGVGNRVGQVKNELGTAQQKFQTDLMGNRIDTDENKQFVDNSLQNATTAAADDSNVNKFQTLLKGAYSGPTGLGNTDALNAQAQEAQQYAQGAGTAAGRTNLLQRYAGGNKYTQGQQRLDNLLLGQTGAQDLKQVRRDSAGLTSELANAGATATSQADAAKAANAGFAQSINDKLGGIDDPSTTEVDESKGIYGNFQKDLDARTKAFQDANYGKYQSLKDATTNNAYTDQDLSTLGLTEGQKLYGTDLSKYINPYDKNQANNQTVATADDYNKYMALNKLSGRENTLLSNRDLAGTATGYTAPDKALLQQELTNSKRDYDSNFAGTTYHNLLDSGRDIYTQAMNRGNYGAVAGDDVGILALMNAYRNGSAPIGVDDYTNTVNDILNDQNVYKGFGVNNFGTGAYDQSVKDFLSQYNTLNTGIKRVPPTTT